MRHGDVEMRDVSNGGAVSNAVNQPAVRVRTCYLCGEPGHVRSDCPKKKAVQQTQKRRRDNQLQYRNKPPHLRFTDVVKQLTDKLGAVQIHADRPYESVVDYSRDHTLRVFKSGEGDDATYWFSESGRHVFLSITLPLPFLAKYGVLLKQLSMLPVFITNDKRPSTQHAHPNLLLVCTSSKPTPRTSYMVARPFNWTTGSMIEIVGEDVGKNDIPLSQLAFKKYDYGPWSEKPRFVTGLKYDTTPFMESLQLIPLRGRPPFAGSKYDGPCWASIAYAVYTHRRPPFFAACLDHVDQLQLIPVVDSTNLLQYWCWCSRDWEMTQVGFRAVYYYQYVVVDCNHSKHAVRLEATIPPPWAAMPFSDSKNLWQFVIPPELVRELKQEWFNKAQKMKIDMVSAAHVYARCAVTCKHCISSAPSGACITHCSDYA